MQRTSGSPNSRRQLTFESDSGLNAGGLLAHRAVSAGCRAGAHPCAAASEAASSTPGLEEGPAGVLEQQVASRMKPKKHLALREKGQR